MFRYNTGTRGVPVLVPYQHVLVQTGTNGYTPLLKSLNPVLSTASVFIFHFYTNSPACTFGYL